MLDVIGRFAFCNKTLNDRATVIDLGAGTGEFAHRLVKKYGCAVHCVEASTRNLGVIEDNDFITKHHYLIGDMNGMVEINLINNRVTHRPKASFHGKESEGLEEMQSLTLEMFLMHTDAPDQLALLKMDIETGEYAVFESTGDETLLRFDQIAVRFYDIHDFNRRQEIKTITKRLNALGYRPIRFSQRLGGNVLFLNTKVFSTNVIQRFLMRVNYRITVALRRLLPGTPK